MFFEGRLSSRILFVNDHQRVTCKAEHTGIAEYMFKPLLTALQRNGISKADYSLLTLNDASDSTFANFLATHSAYIIVPLGEKALQLVAGEVGIDKWQCSVIKSKAITGQRKVLPLYHPEHIQQFFSDHAFYFVGAEKLKKEILTDAYTIPERKMHLVSTFKEAKSYLEAKVLKAKEIAVDFEFSRGLINTVGFAVSSTEAIAIRTSPELYNEHDYWQLWLLIAEVLEGPAAKIIQHACVEVSWAARYGIEIKNVTHDTMWAMKFLNPEFDKGLDNVGRIYTPFPYWKDDNDDWSNIRNWPRHLEYNCKDTTGTFAAYINQVKELKERGIYSLFTGFVMRFQPVIQEMCNTGLNVNVEALHVVKQKLTREHENFMRIIDQECLSHCGKTINPRSGKQLKEALETMGMKLPTKRGKNKNGAIQEVKTTTDKKALAKLRRQHPDAAVLPALIGISATNKQLSSYTDFDYDKGTARVHYTLDGCGTETGRWAGYVSSWGEGFNPQTIPSSAKGIFRADEVTCLVEIDLEKAESWYVALDSPDERLIELLESDGDIHRYVASKIYNKPEALIGRNSPERQLGKKVGHASNYGTGPRTFAETCLAEMNLYITETEAKHMLEAYFQAFPGIKRRQERLKNEVYQKRYLKTPMGRERYFFGRMDDATCREAYAYQPQSTIPDITNTLMLKLWDNRDYLGLAYEDQGRFLLQVHDSLLLQMRPERLGELAGFCRDLSNWHPTIWLSGGQLKIPVSVKAGKNWKAMEAV